MSFCSCYILPDEILLKIFNYCDAYTLSQLSDVCEQYRRVSHTVLIKKSNYLLVTNQMSKKFRQRCKPLLSYNSKFITNYHWKYRICQERKIHRILDTEVSEKCLQMTKNNIWFFDYNRLFVYNRLEDGTIRNDKKYKTSCVYKFKFNDIVYCNGKIISGHTDGSICHWKMISRRNRNYIKLLKVHSNVHESVYDIDATSRHVISSDRRSIKLQKNIHKDDSIEEIKMFERSTHLLNAISFDPTGTKIAVTAVNCCLRNEQFYYQNRLSTFILYDIDKRDYLINKKEKKDIGDKKNPACFQLLWEDPHTILMCYKYYIKKMDTRTSEFVRTWDAYSFFERDNVYDILTCFSSDNLYTIITGTGRNGVRLWDQRQNFPIQLYNYKHQCVRMNDRSYYCFYSRNHNCVQSVQFDSAHMYAVTNDGLIEYNFESQKPYSTLERLKM